MRALTLTQHWAGLVASGIKLVENRPRRIAPRDLFGKQFAIHAGRQQGDLATWRRVVELAPETALDFPGPMAPGARVRKLMDVTSAVIAVATLQHELHGGWDEAAIAEHRESLRVQLKELTGDVDQVRWFFGPIGYILRDVHALAKPVPCKGALGFWTLPADVERAVRAQIEAA
jgi:hypothetical protein